MEVGVGRFGISLGSQDSAPLHDSVPKTTIKVFVVRLWLAEKWTGWAEVALIMARTPHRPTATARAKAGRWFLLGVRRRFDPLPLVYYWRLARLNTLRLAI